MPGIDEIRELIEKIEREVSIGHYPRELFEELRDKIKELEIKEVMG